MPDCKGAGKIPPFSSGSVFVHYEVIPAPGGHRYGIRQVFTVQAPGECRLYLPVWIPGSYMRRDFARLLYGLRATVNGEAAELRLRSPSAWALDIAEPSARVELRYEVYARDISVRGNYLDHERGFFNPCAACIAVEGHEAREHTLHVVREGHFLRWQLLGGARQGERGFVFSNYDHLIDTPLMLGAQLREAEFVAGGVVHHVAVSGACGAFDFARLCADVGQICQTAVAMFGQLPDAVKRYAFLLHVTDDTYGGLEHRESTLLMVPRRDLPQAGMTDKSSGYIRLLGLFSHEYFHTWNVKDLKPRDYQPYQVQAEQPTDMLWLFEGFTAYFDDLLLLRAGVISATEYRQLLARNISAYWQRRGKAHQTLAQSSLEAWTKLYNGGENAQNASTSYYGHGALFAFCLDAWLQAHGNTRLDAVLVGLWRKYRTDGEGLDEAAFSAFVLAQLPDAQHDAFLDFMRRGLHSTEELPLVWAGAQQGLVIEAVPEEGCKSECGFRWQGADLAVQQLNPDSAAALAGLGMDDRIVAVNRIRATPERLRELLLGAAPDDSVTLHVFRDGLLYDFTFTLAAPPATTCKIHSNMTDEVKP